jgi:hypothetical protein
VRARVLAAGLCLAAITFAARAASAGEDGAYDRLSGDLDLRVGAGVALGEGGPSFAATAAAVYLSTAGVYFRYADAFGREGPPIRRSLGGGIHLQPVFLARYASNAETGPAHLDLFLDSFAFVVGAFWQQPQKGSFDEEPGVEIGLGAGVPVFANASGPWLDLSAVLRWRAADQRRPGSADAIERGGLLTVTLGWHQIARGHVVDAGDALRR